MPGGRVIRRAAPRFHQRVTRQLGLQLFIFEENEYASSSHAGSERRDSLYDRPVRWRCRWELRPGRVRIEMQRAADEAALKGFLMAAPTHGGSAGGLFNGKRCGGRLSTATVRSARTRRPPRTRRRWWPGSQAIAKAKAYTANAFSLDSFVLSTARLYTFTQPGHSLWSLGQSNLFDPKYLAAPTGQAGGKETDRRRLIFFGGGVPRMSRARSSAASRQRRHVVRRSRNRQTRA